MLLNYMVSVALSEYCISVVTVTINLFTLGGSHLSQLELNYVS